MSGGFDGAPVRPVALVILDGWGLAAGGPGNAVELANTPVFDALMARYPHGTLQASGLAVGLPEGQIGNSEVGHLNLGAGRVVYQDLTRIDLAVQDGSFAASDVLQRAIMTAAQRESTFHIVGLLSRGGVHSHLNHVLAAVHAAVDAGVQRVLVHAITDGRDVAPDASLTDVSWFAAQLSALADERDVDVRIATVIGRYWAMDRDRRFDRTQRAYEAFTTRAGRDAETAVDAVRLSQVEGITDEFVEPWIIAPPDAVEGETDAIVDGDVVFFANFRPDRMRQLVHAFVDVDHSGFARSVHPSIDAIGMTKYADDLDLPVVFEPQDVHETLADVIEANGLGQLHVAETEKYAHVTYFFNGGVESVHAGEERRMVDSPRDVATYDLRPQMSAHGVADMFVDAIADAHIAFAVLNFANPDMVGHTGVIEAAIAAVEATDTELARVLAAVEARGGVAIVTADHGNAEVMLTPQGTPHTAHTTNLVPVVITVPNSGVHDIRERGILADIAPTVLDLLDLPQPAAMTGTSLLAPVEARMSGRSA